MHKTCYVTRIRDWSSDVCSSDLVEDGEVDGAEAHLLDGVRLVAEHAGVAGLAGQPAVRFLGDGGGEVLHAKGDRVVRHVDVPAAPFGLGAAGEQEADGRRGGGKGCDPDWACHGILPGGGTIGMMSHVIIAPNVL